MEAVVGAGVGKVGTLICFEDKFKSIVAFAFVRLI